MSAVTPPANQVTSRSPRRGPRLSMTVLTAMILFGFTLLVVAWVGASGELLVSTQLEWLLGAGLPGLVFVVLGARGMWLAEVKRLTRGVDRLAVDVARLHAQIVGDSAGILADHAPVRADRVVAVDGGTTYHREDCAMLAAKQGVEAISATARSGGERSACKLCGPDA